MIKALIVDELRMRKYKSFSEKECNIMYNNIQEKCKIFQQEFWDGLSALVDDGLLLCRDRESGQKYYALSDKLKNELGIT